MPETPVSTLVKIDNTARINPGLSLLEIRALLINFNQTIPQKPGNYHEGVRVREPIITRLENDNQQRELNFYPHPASRQANKNQSVPNALYLADIFAIVEQIRELLRKNFANYPDVVNTINNQKNLLLETYVDDGGENYLNENKLADYLILLQPQISQLIEITDSLLIADAGKSAGTTTGSSAATAATTGGPAGGFDGALARPKPTKTEGGEDSQTQPQQEEKVQTEFDRASAIMRQTNAILLSNKPFIKSLLGFEFDNIDQIPPEVQDLFAQRIAQYLSAEDLDKLIAGQQTAIIFGRLRSKIATDAPLWAAVSRHIIPLAQAKNPLINPEDNQSFFEHQIDSLTLGPTERENIRHTIDSMIVAGIEPSFFTALPKEDLARLFGLDNLDPNQAEEVLGIIRVYWAMRREELAFFTQNPLLQQNLDWDESGPLKPLMKSFGQRVGAIGGHKDISPDNALNSIISTRQVLTQHNAPDVLYALISNNEHLQLDQLRRQEIDNIKRQFLLSMIEQEEEALNQMKSDIAFSMNLEKVSVLKLSVRLENYYQQLPSQPPDYNPGQSAVNASGRVLASSSGQKGAQSPETMLNNWARIGSMVPDPTIQLASRAYLAAPRPIKKIIAQFASMFSDPEKNKKRAKTLALGLLAGGAGLIAGALYIIRQFPLAALGGMAGLALAPIFGPAAPIVGFGAGMWVQNAAGSVTSAVKGAVNGVSSTVSGVGDSIGKLFGGSSAPAASSGFSSGLSAMSSNINTAMIVSGAGAGVIVAGGAVLGTFLQPFSSTLFDESKYVQIEKTASPDNSEVPSLINYQITLTPKDGYKIKIVNINDTAVIYYKKDREGGDGIKSHPASDNYPSVFDQYKDKELSAGEELKIEYALDFSNQDYSGAAIVNTFLVNFSIVEGEDAGANSQASDVARVCFGDCPKDLTGCWPTYGEITQEPYDESYCAKKDADWSHCNGGRNKTYYPDAYDIANLLLTPINSSVTGTVTTAARDSDYGNYVVINSGSIKMLYAHMEQILVKKGQEIEVGDPVGLMGSTGNSSGSHLHMETSSNIGPGGSDQSILRQIYNNAMEHMVGGDERYNDITIDQMCVK